MEEIIKKAIDGGWDKANARVYDCDGHDSQHVDELMLMDKTFWQSLGKACGWHYCRFHSFMGKDSEVEVCHDCTHDEWCKKALRFHEINLTEGWDKAVKWLNDLIK